MSKYTGKCDLYDHVFMIGYHGTTDEMTELEKFEIFKKRTGGVIYTYFPLELTKLNIDNEIKMVNNPDILSKNEDGSYTYFFTKYKKLNQINKRGYYAIKEIHFDDILDLFPYFTHIISSMGSDENTETIYITYQDYNSMKEEEARLLGYERFGTSFMKKYIKEDLIRIIKEYY